MKISLPSAFQTATELWQEGATPATVRGNTLTTTNGAGTVTQNVLDGDQLVDAIVSEAEEQVEPVVLIIDDLHELKSADALTQLERVLATLPSSASSLATSSDCLVSPRGTCPMLPRDCASRATASPNRR